MKVDLILQTMTRQEVSFLLIGGMNFFLHHQPLMTLDIDLWVEDTEENLRRVNQALRELGAEWGKSEDAWDPVPENPAWLQGQSVFCLTTPHGALDIFRRVQGLASFSECLERARLSPLPCGLTYRSLSDQDMLACQLALPEQERRLDRVHYLQKLLP